MRVTRQSITMTKRSTLILVVSLCCFIFFVLEMQLSNLKAVNKKIEEQLVYNIRRDNDLQPVDSSQQVSRSNLPIVIYNRISKTGSTSFTNQVYDLAKLNKIYVIHVNISKNNLKISLADQLALVNNMTTWEERKPAFYHGHFSYLPFSQFGAAEPLYINILREPLERLISHYYFLRYGDDYRKGLRRAKQGDTTTFDECFTQQSHGCQARDLWLQIPVLCGHTAECWKVGSQWALNQAKNNIISKYMLVGLTEQMEDFIVVLETTMPRMFKGLTNKFRNGEKSHIRKTIHKEPPSEETVKQLQASKIYRMERELYDFAQKQFEFIKRLTTYVDDGHVLQPLFNQFHYEKIYGPNGNIKS